ncbi:MAG: hypothetical protein K0Q93_2327 [Nocardioidaceae bacterium]|nr:hypothetical protein [Nocardioidaceae bacterium]
MSHPIPATIYRVGAAAGCGSAVILLINAAKRAEVISTSPLTQLIAPLAQILAGRRPDSGIRLVPVGHSRLCHRDAPNW